MFYFPLLLMLAALPVFALMLFVYINAGKRKISIKLVILLGVMGGISTIPAAIIEHVGGAGLARMHMSSELKTLIELFLIVGVIEELGKYLSLVFLTWKHPNFQHSYSAIVYSVSASLGFALVENILYVLLGGAAVGVVRAFTAVPLHCMVAILMGFLYAIGREAAYQKQTGKCISFMCLAYVMPVMVHGFYDYIVTKTSESLKYIGLLALVVLGILAVGIVLLLYASKKNHRLDGAYDPPYQDMINVIPYYPSMPYGGMQPYGGMSGYGNMQPYEGMQSYGSVSGYGGVQPYGEMPGYGGVQPYGGMPGYGGMQPYGEMPEYGNMQPYGEMPMYGNMQSPVWNYGYTPTDADYYTAAGYVNSPMNIDVYGAGNPEMFYAPGKEQPKEE